MAIGSATESAAMEVAVTSTMASSGLNATGSRTCRWSVPGEVRHVRRTHSAWPRAPARSHVQPHRPPPPRHLSPPGSDLGQAGRWRGDRGPRRVWRCGRGLAWPAH
eukprot:4267904-Pyramimonas_sp.AAC.1